MNSTYSACLDEILRFVNTYDNLQGKSVERTFDELTPLRMALVVVNSKITDTEFLRMIDYLENEGYLMVHKISQPYIIQITLKGIDFISDEVGGFTAKRKNAILEARHRQAFD